MTDVIRPANGQAANAQSPGNGWQDLNRTSGYDAAIRGRTLVAPESGEARAWPKRPGTGAESPAGWLLPTDDGEAAPPSRPGMESARSDETARAPGVDGDDRRGARYQDPQPTALLPLRALWPWTFQAGSRHVPVVGPTEALRGRAGVPGTAASADAVAGLLDPAQRSSWQLAQEVWQESGVIWERAAPGIADVDPATGWLPDPQPLAFEPQDDDPQHTDPPDFQSLAPEPLAPEPIVADAWPGAPEAAEPQSDDPHPAAFDPAATDAWPAYTDPVGPDPWSAEPGPEGGQPADTWFTGVGPVDTRFAGARPADPGSVGDGPDAGEGAGPYFADSGVAPMQSESPSRRQPRQPDFPTADDPRAAAQRAGRDDTDRRGPTRANVAGQAPAPQDFMRPGPPGEDAMQRRPTRQSRPNANPTRPEPIGEDLARDDAMRRGSPENPARPDPGQPQRPRRPGPTWNEYPASGFPGQAWPAGRVPLGAPVALDVQAPESDSLAASFNAAGPDAAAGSDWVGQALPLGESDELFRAWQGSVNEAAAGRGSWSVPRRGGPGPRRRRALQVAAIGVPVAVIVTVGVGALMILTGKANEMLAVRADTGAPSPAASATGTSGTGVGAHPTAGDVGPAFVSATLSGYPGQRGSVTVASMAATAGVTLAVGTADRHPAIWRRASNGSWTLESAATLGALTGAAGLVSVAHGPAGWIAVGAASDGGATAPVIFASADGVQWQPLTALADRAGAGTEFLGAAAGRAGYVVVGRQMTRGRTFAVLWYSADLQTWTADNNGGLDGRLAASTANAVVATAGGFVAVGSHGADQFMWVSSDGRHWDLDYVAVPAGAASATLRSVAATGTRVVAGGYAATRDGDIPVVVVSADGGGWRQVVLKAPSGLGVITALTATPNGFTAAGVVGPRGSQHAVTWTSPDGLTWSAPAQASGREITALTATGNKVTGTAEQGTTPTLVPLPAP
jgi:hypothetical protein